MKRWLPHPWLTLAVAVSWLGLQQSLAGITVLAGIGLGLLLGRLWQRLQPPAMTLRHPHLLLGLAARVLADIIASNLAVARRILARRMPDSAFIAIDLAIERPAALAVLAGIITATPGTIWVRHDAGQRQLLIHVLDERAAARLVDTIKRRYEPPLQEIFE